MQLETYANSTATTTTDSPPPGGREEGGKALKSCFWQLTKARQSKAKGALTVESAFLASNVREEFRARTRVMILPSSSSNHKVPLLLDEEEDKTANVRTTTSTTTTLSLDATLPPTFVLYDTVEEYRKGKNGATTDDDNTAVDATIFSKTTTTKDGGLRQRKNKSKNEDKENQKNNKEGILSSSSWELVDELDANNNKDADLDYDEVLQDFQVDPLELLGGGFPPRELRRAQEEAHKALTSYIQAANAAALLLHSLRQAAGNQ
jgi:hypothetical protein